MWIPITNLSFLLMFRWPNTGANWKSFLKALVTWWLLDNTVKRLPPLFGSSFMSSLTLPGHKTNSSDHSDILKGMPCEPAEQVVQSLSGFGKAVLIKLYSRTVLELPMSPFCKKDCTSIFFACLLYSFSTFLILPNQYFDEVYGNTMRSYLPLYYHGTRPNYHGITM